MAFQSNGPVTLQFPAFRGMTRKLVLAGMCAYFALLVLGIVSPRSELTVASALLLQPQVLWPQVWRAATYSFVQAGVLSTLMTLIALWMFAAPLEDERGSRWLLEFAVIAAVGGGLLASGIALIVGRFAAALDPASGLLAVGGLWALVTALIVAVGVVFAEMEFRFMLVVTMKAKYLAAIYVLFYLALTLGGGDRFGPLTALCATGCGYAYLKMAPRRGLGWAGSEMWFGWRNAYYRAKRRRAAKKFTVYMKKQGKNVNIDQDGRYVDPSGTPRDPNDRRWMN